MSSEIILYVRSAKIPKRNVQVFVPKQGEALSRFYGVPQRAHSYYDQETVIEYDFVLPEDQMRMVEEATELASEHGFVLTVVDLTKESAFSNWKFDHSKKIKTLPALVADSGEIAEGIMTKEQIEAFLFKAGKSAT
ncbi:MAG: hypothetical protein WCD81_12110 [Candidatus Bathyarchaeia archaeon]